MEQMVSASEYKQPRDVAQLRCPFCGGSLRVTGETTIETDAGDVHAPSYGCACGAVVHDVAQGQSRPARRP